MHAEIAKNGELVLAPRNKTLFTCDHCHVVHMPNTPTGQPYKLVTCVGDQPHIYSFELAAAVRYVVLSRRIKACDCVRVWAMARELHRA